MANGALGPVECRAEGRGAKRTEALAIHWMKDKKILLKDNNDGIQSRILIDGGMGIHTSACHCLGLNLMYAY